MFLLQLGLVTVYMVLLPYLIGCLVIGKKMGQQRDTGARILATGLMVSYALYEVLALGFVRYNGSFRLLSKVFGVVFIGLAGISAVKLIINRRIKLNQSHRTKGEKKPPDLFFWMGIVLIVIQIGAIIFMATPDKDDAFYSGLSSVCFSQDVVLQKDTYDGLLQRAVGKRYILSALPVYQATLSYLSGGIHHLVITHNLFPLFYMPLAYALLYGIGKELLWAEGIKKADGKLLFCLALLHMIGNYFVFSPENFLVTRLWQGKALFVALGVPVLWQQAGRAIRGMLEGEKQVREWLLVLATLIAVLFMGETGLYLGPFMLACLCLAYALNEKKIRHFIPAALCCMPQMALLAWIFL